MRRPGLFFLGIAKTLWCVASAILATGATRAAEVASSADPAFSPERGAVPTWGVSLPSEEADRRFYAIVADADGGLVAAHGDITLHDGFTTRRLPRPGGVYTGALALDREGRIWTGNAVELGFYERDETGEWRFTSLREQVPEADRAWQIIWAVHCVDDAVIFVASQQVMRWRAGRMEVLPLSAERRLFSSPDGDAGVLLIQRTRHVGATGYIGSVWRLGAEGPPALVLPGHGLGSAMLTLRDERDGSPFVALMHDTPEASRTAWIARYPDAAFPTHLSATAWTPTASGHAWGAVEGLFGTTAQGRPRFLLTKDPGTGGELNAESITRGADGRVWTVNLDGLLAADPMAAVTALAPERGGVSVRAIGRVCGGIYFAGPKGFFTVAKSPDDGRVTEAERLLVPAEDLQHVRGSRWGRALLKGRHYAFAGHSDGIGVLDKNSGRGLGWIGAAGKPTESRTLSEPWTAPHENVLIATNQGEVMLFFIGANEDGGARATLLHTWTLPDVETGFGLPGLRHLVADAGGRVRLLRWRHDPASGAWSEAGAPQLIAPTAGIGGILQWQRDGDDVLAFTRSGPWRWRGGETGFERVGHDGAPGLVVLALARHPDGRAWALASIPAFGRASDDGARLLHGVWPVWVEADGRMLRGLDRVPTAVVDRIGVYATSFFETSSPAGAGSVWWLGGSRGVMRLALDHLPMEGRPPPAPRLLSLRDSEGRRLSLARPPRIGGARGLEIEATVAEVAQSLPLAIQTRLGGAGLAGEWSAPSRDATRRWDRLPGGRLQLGLRAVNAAGVAGPELTREIEIAPRFHETAWFWPGVVAVLVAVGATILFAWTARLRRARARLEKTVGERTSALLATNEELARQSARRTELVGVVSHEIRSPLIGASLLAERLAARVDEPGQAEDARQLREQLRGLRLVLDGTLDLSRFELGLVPVRWERVRAREFFARVLGGHAAAAAAKGLVWHVDAPEPDRTLLVDGVNLARILHNMVGNAVKYTEAGEVRVVAKFDPGTDALCVRVCDTGPGLPAGVAETLHSTDHRRLPLGSADSVRAGSGLGLALACRLIALGGDALVRGETMIGTELAFSVPALGVADTTAEDGEADFEPPFDGSVLVLEDERGQREHMCDVLEPLGIAVDVAATCADALGRCAEARYDLALLDFNLPDGTGLELLLRLRAEGRAPRHVAMVTAHASAPIERACRDAGCSAFLPKPLTLRAALKLLGAAGLARRAQPSARPNNAAR